jgi:hypothetical protein
MVAMSPNNPFATARIEYIEATQLSDWRFPKNWDRVCGYTGTSPFVAFYLDKDRLVWTDVHLYGSSTDTRLFFAVREVVDLAERLAAEKGDGKIIVGGKISRQFSETLLLGNHGPTFSGGFIKYSAGLRDQPLRGENLEIKGVADYRPAKEGQSPAKEAP